MTLAEVDAEDQGLSRRNLRALAVPAPRLFGMRTVHHYMYLPAAARIPAGAVGEERPPAAKQKSIAHCRTDEAPSTLLRTDTFGPLAKRSRTRNQG